jgi:predicted peptidase
MRTALFAVSLAATALFPASTGPAPQQTAERFAKEITRTVAADYLLFLPEGYEPGGAKKWPLILFLHGAGERGSDLAKVKVHGPPKLVEQQQDFPFVVVSPQCPARGWWDDEVLLALLDDVLQKHAIDPDRVYLTGLSMGGYGTWSLGARAADRFAALAPICGGGTFGQAYRLADMPIWVFHGKKDNVVPIEESERMVQFLGKRGNKQVEFTVYPEAGHDAWTETYSNPKLYEWFLAHRRGERRR